MLRPNALKASIKSGKSCIAAMLSLPSAQLAEMLAASGADAVIIEAEHSAINEAQVEDMARAVELGGATALCRVPAGNAELILRVLDAGAMGVVIPHVKTAADARAAVRAAKYPPEGARGAGTSRASGYGAMARDAYVALANREIMVIPMIEDPEAVDAIDSIVAVPGIDCLFIGRGDLSLTMGVGGNDPRLIEAVNRVVAAAKAAGMPFMVAAEEAEARDWMKRGAAIISIQVVQLFRRRWSELTTELNRGD